MAEYPGNLPAYNSPEGVAIREAYTRCVIDGPGGPLLRVWDEEAIPLAGLAARITKKGKVEVFYPLGVVNDRHRGWLVAEALRPHVARLFGLSEALEAALAETSEKEVADE